MAAHSIEVLLKKGGLMYLVNTAVGGDDASDGSAAELSQDLCVIDHIFLTTLAIRRRARSRFAITDHHITM